MAKKGKLIELTVKGRKIKLDSEDGEFQVRKTEWRNNQFKEFSIGDEIEYEIDSDGNFKFIGIKRNKIVKVSKELKEKSKPKRNKIVKVSKELKGKSKPKRNKDAFDYPYNFVSLGNKNNIDRQNMASDEYRKKMKFSGKLECTLENFTPLFTAGKKNPLSLKDKKGKIYNHEQEDFLKDRDNYIVPSSTLKTTVRTVMEVLTNSCMRNVGEKPFKDKKTKNKFSPYDKIPKEYRPCNDPKKLCFACRLFGSTGNDKEGKKGFESFAGRVQFTDAIIPIKEAKIENNYQILVPLGGPHEEFAGFYLKDGGNYNNSKTDIRGRKFYWHHVDKIGKPLDSYKKYFTQSAQKKFNSSAKYMHPNNQMSFSVNFQNLTAEELGVLIFSLELEDGLLHKIGKGKCIGFGSCGISIDKFLLESKDKYSSFSNPYAEAKKDEFINAAKDKYFDENRKEIQELKAILSIENSLDFKERAYPKVKWFGEMKINLGKEFKLPEILEY